MVEFLNPKEGEEKMGIQEENTQNEIEIWGK